MLKWTAIAAGLIVLIICGVMAVHYEQQRRESYQIAELITGGNPDLGRAKLRRYGCSSCHIIPGVPGAVSQVGPSLKGFAFRTYIAGQLPNTSANLRHWIEHPHEIEPRTAMPDTGVTEADSRDLAAYLYTLR